MKSYKSRQAADKDDTASPGRHARFYAPPSAWDGMQVVLPSDETHHMVNVLSIERGEIVAVFDGKGVEATARLASIGTSSATLQLLNRSEHARPVSITLIQALPKAQKMDLIVEKATELGVTVIVPVTTDRTVVRPAASDASARGERWRRIALNAARQCRTAWMPEVWPVMSLADALKQHSRQDILLAGALDCNAVPLREAMEQGKRKSPTSIGCLIGPEGDFTAEEVRMMLSAGAIITSFGRQVLRVETAALYMLAAIAYEFGTLGAAPSRTPPVAGRCQDAAGASQAVDPS